LPQTIGSNGWWTVEGEKMSKSLGNSLDVRALAAEFGVDAVRFFMFREIPFGNDGDFSRKALISRLNVELANDLGNLAQRVLSFVAKNAGGVVPARGAVTEADAALLETAAALPAKMRDALDRLALHEALEDAWKLIRAANAYIDHQAPWALKKTDTARMDAVLRVLLDVLRTVGVLLQPFMPDSMGKLLDQLGVAAEARQIAASPGQRPPVSARW
jgi:methionyl-tRNA synthetase